ncbi:c2 domain-containing protein [Nephila pilipes]|uniref:C2 domain-containing protein n=1 Tax=Nephila pilipes TaxID=299642 RepID=A0A8X6T4M5_NEPPI|nr:c2 domain-containing protein [Nephila pilipes]
MVIGSKSVSRPTTSFTEDSCIRNDILQEESQVPLDSPNKANGQQLEKITSEIILPSNASIEEINEKFSNLNPGELTELLDKSISYETTVILYTMSVYTINNFKASAGPKSCSFAELYTYLDKIIPLKREVKLDCFEKAVCLRSPDFVLDMKIIEALHLKSKKLSKSSRLFCKLWMSNDPESVKTTKTVDYSKRPVWNECYRFDAKSLKGNTVHLEIRKSNAGDSSFHSKRKQSLSFHERNNINDEDAPETMSECKDEKDILIGWSEIKVADVHCEGNDTWVPIKSMKNGRIKGYLHLNLKIGVSQYYGGICALKRHLLLIRMCLEDCSKNNNYEQITKWQQVVSSTATILIFLHSTIESIPVCEDVISWFIVINQEARRSNKVSFQFLHNLLLGCEKNIRQLPRSRNKIERSLEEMYHGEAAALNRSCIHFIGNLRSFDLVENKTNCREFETSLKIIQVSSTILKLRMNPIDILKLVIPQFLKTVMKQIPDDPKNKAKYLIKLIENLKRFLKAADSIVEKVYPELLYSSIVHEDLYSFFHEILKGSINEINICLLNSEDNEDELRADSLKLFGEFKNLIFYICKSMKDQAFETHFQHLCEWFSVEVVEYWFERNKDSAIRKIKMALCFDDMIGISTFELGFRKEKISSSARIVPEIMKNCLIELWMMMSNSRSSYYNILFINSLHECCIEYAARILKLHSSEMSSTDKYKESKMRLYIVVNDLSFISSFVFQTISNTVKILPSNVPDSRAFLLDECQKVCVIICEAHATVAEKHIKKVSEARNKLKQKLALKKYVDFMNKVLWKKADRFMTFEAFKIFSLEFWNRMLNIIQNCVKAYETERNDNASNDLKCNMNKSKLIFDGLLEILKETKKLCSNVDMMNRIKDMWSAEFTELERSILSVSQ